MQYKDIQASVKSRIKPNRYKHTMGVVATAVSLAQIYGADVEKARLAALMHDCAKSMSDEEKIKLCKDFGMSISDAEYASPGLLHAKAGSILAEHEYGIIDYDILHAILVHTTGVEDMNLLDEIIFVSDYIEPSRDQAPRLEELRELAKTDLQMAVYIIMGQTIDYLKATVSDAIDDTTINAFNYYKSLIESRNTEE